MSHTAIKVTCQGIGETTQKNVAERRKRRKSGSLRGGRQKIMYPFCVPEIPVLKLKGKEENGVENGKEKKIFVWRARGATLEWGKKKKTGEQMLEGYRHLRRGSSGMRRGRI